MEKAEMWSEFNFDRKDTKAVRDMAYNANQRRRRALRLKDYDYSQPGAYFITICMQHRACLFGEIVVENMRLNDAGQTVELWWAKLSSKFPTVETGDYVVMPNHFHGIIVIVENHPPAPGVGADRCVRPDQNIHTKMGAHIGAPLPRVVQWFKTMTTNAYIRGVKQLGWPRFPGTLWQRGYYEHIIRSDNELNQIREYIIMNPAKWTWDAQNPMANSRPAPEAPWQV